MSTKSGIRVAITGMDTICGLGHNLKEVWNGLLEGKSGISLIENHDVTNLPVHIAGEVKNFSLAEDILPPNEAKRFDRFLHFALHCAINAWADSGLKSQNPYRPDNIGCIMGVGMGGFPEIERTYRTFLEKGARRVTPFFIPSLIPNMASGLISITLGTTGMNYSLSSACASAGHAITAAYNEIIAGRQDVMVTGGAESVICDLPIAGFASMKALSRRNDNPTHASRPFDLNRDGFVMGEGAGLLILENLDKAKARGAKIYAEIVGCGSSSDAYHITAPHPEGIGASQCMLDSIKSAQINPEEIGYVNAHGTSTPLGDIGETKALKATFGSHAKKIQISSTKSMTGHLLGAAGGLETIVCAMALYQGALPPTINLETPDPECDLDYIPNAARKVQVEYALNNSFGFGGTNSSLILKRFC